AYTGISNYYDRLKNPGMHYWIELARPGSSVIQQVNDRRVFRTDEKIRIHLNTNAPGTVLVHHTGSSGRNKTFPVDMRGGQEYVIPSATGWLRFDYNKGFERIELIFIPGGGGQAHIGASGAEFNRLYDNYSQSKSLITSVVDGEKISSLKEERVVWAVWVVTIKISSLKEEVVVVTIILPMDRGLTLMVAMDRDLTRITMYRIMATVLVDLLSIQPVSR
ncbi:MAG: hypothetical protein D3906_16405, partial [Candidatus Electrothrix sp. AUS1_2]|nr:hypothetical protein [Candidatus Electrothrix sp. AUS1_2]